MSDERLHFVHIRLTADELKRLKLEAEQDERSLSVWARRKLLDGVRELPKPPPPPPPAPPAPKVFPKRAPFYIDGELIGEVTLNAHGHMNMQENTPFLNKHVVPMGIPFRALIPLAMRTPVGEDGCLRFVIAGDKGEPT